MPVHSLSFNIKLIMGYAASKDFLKDNAGDGFESYVYGQSILHISLPYAFHISGSVGLVTSLISRALHSSADALVFAILVSVFLFTTKIATSSYKKTISFQRFLELRAAYAEMAVDEKKKLQQDATLFFIFNVLFFLLVEIPLVFLL